EATEPSPGFERVGAGERRAKQRQETIEEAVVLNEIARHHRIGHGSGEQLLNEAMPHGIRPGRLARSAQDFGEAFRHDFGPHLTFDHKDSGSMKPRDSLTTCSQNSSPRESLPRRPAPLPDALSIGEFSAGTAFRSYRGNAD